MDNTTDALMQLLFKLAYPPRKPNSNMTDAEYRSHKRDFLRRGLCCTPYGGNYNKLAGWIVCVVGSAPKGTLTVPISDVTNPQVEEAYYFYGKTYRFASNPKHLAILEAFFNEHLAGQNKALTLDTKPMYA